MKWGRAAWLCPSKSQGNPNSPSESRYSCPVHNKGSSTSAFAPHRAASTLNSPDAETGKKAQISGHQPSAPDDGKPPALGIGHPVQGQQIPDQTADPTRGKAAFETAALQREQQRH